MTRVWLGFFTSSSPALSQVNRIGEGRLKGFPTSYLLSFTPEGRQGGEYLLLRDIRFQPPNYRSLLAIIFYTLADSDGRTEVGGQKFVNLKVCRFIGFFLSIDSLLTGLIGLDNVYLRIIPRRGTFPGASSTSPPHLLLLLCFLGKLFLLVSFVDWIKDFLTFGIVN